MDQTIKIAIDAMGGDYAPDSVIEGASSFVSQYKDVELHFFGDSSRIEPLIDKYSNLRKFAIVHHTESFVSNVEKAGNALRSGRDSSMRLAINSVKEGLTDAVVSAGNTGALMAMSKFVFKTIANVSRPAIAAMIPKFGKDCVMLDLGANSECTSKNLLDFAKMGEVYVEAALDIENPRIGLLNIGAEQIKGNEVVKEADEIFRDTKFRGRYVGFVEGDVIIGDSVDVIVVDGFAGNISLKTAEGIAKLFGSWMKESFKKSFFRKLVAFFARNAIKELKYKADPDRRNGALFLGLKHICIKSHGGADAQAFSHALSSCRKLVKQDIISKLSKALESQVPELETAIETLA